MSPVRTLLSSSHGQSSEGNGAVLAAEALGLIEVVRFLPGDQVEWRRTQAGDRRLKPRRRRIPK